MKTLTTTIAAGLALLVAAGSAMADPRHRDDRRDGDAAIAGIIGATAGFIVGSALNDGRTVTVDRRWQTPHHSSRVPTYRTETRVREGDPWTRSWYRYCENRYRSFDARRGTFRGFDGRTQFCVMPVQERPGYRYQHRR